VHYRKQSNRFVCGVFRVPVIGGFPVIRIQIFRQLYGGLQKREEIHATELPFLEISPKPTTTRAFRSRPRHDGPIVASGVSSTAGRRPETRTCHKPRLGRGLSTTDNFVAWKFRGGRCGLDTTDDCGLEFSRGLDVGPRLGRAGPRFGRGQVRRAPWG